MLFGLQAPAVSGCRVLELGCGDGGNLIPLAYALPDSQFVGIDLSSTAVATARSRANELGLANVQFCAKDLLGFSEVGQFDYIVAHGVYSWVPAKVREQVLKICSQHLSQNGIAYISFNALPGGYMRRYARDLMLFHTRAIGDPTTKVKEARNILDIALMAAPAGMPEREMLKRESDINRHLDSFMYHDILSEVNDPIYFLDFLNQAATHGLQFLGEAQVNVAPAFIPENVRKQLDALPDRRVREQYLDFFFCRRFRQTLLCRAGHQLASSMNAMAIEQLLICGSLQPSGNLEELNDTDVVQFAAPRGQTVKLQERIPKALFLTLNEAYPHALSMPQLLQGAWARLGIGEATVPEELKSKIRRTLLSAYLNGVIDFVSCQPAFTTEVTEKPTASLLARKQAMGGEVIVSMSLLNNVEMGPIEKCILPLLDGTRDPDQLLRTLSASTEGSAEAITSESVARALQSLAKSGMLIA